MAETVRLALAEASVEEAKVLKEVMAVQKEMMLMEKKAQGRAVVRLSASQMAIPNVVAMTDVKEWSYKVSMMFDVVVGKIDNETKTQSLTPAIAAKTVVKSTLKKYTGKEWAKAFARKAKLVKEAETTVPPNLKDLTKKFVSTQIMAVRLATLRKVGALWDKKGIRLEPDARILTTNERAALDTAMATIEERAFNDLMAKQIYGIRGDRGDRGPNDMCMWWGVII